MTEFPSLRRLNVSYTLVHVVYWAMFAIFAGYQTSLLLGRGFTSGEAGIFASIRCFAGILAQPLLGGWADRHPEVPIKRLLNACLVLALGVNVVFYTTRPGFWGTALIFLTLGILELNAYPLLDSMAVPVHRRRGGHVVQPQPWAGVSVLCPGLRCVRPAGGALRNRKPAADPHGAAGADDRGGGPVPCLSQRCLAGPRRGRSGPTPYCTF